MTTETTERPRARWTRTAAAAGLALAAAAGPLAAQVGHDPARSPFRDLTTGQSLTFSLGWFGGNTAVARVGWRSGPSFGLRLDTRLGGPVDLWVSTAFVGSSRLKIDATLDSATRVSGPFRRTLVLADLGMLLNLTGAKTWHGLAPYVGFGAGEVLPMKGETDPGGYHAGVNFSFIPVVGTRVFATRRLAARLELRDNIFRYEWPLRYFDPLDKNNVAITPPILPSTLKDKQWTHNITFSVGFVYGFNF